MDSISGVITLMALHFGVLIHHLIIRFEIDSLASEIVQLHLVAVALIAVVYWVFRTTTDGVISIISSALWVVGCLDAGFISKMVCYRLVFHPLRKFPGPFGARLTKFWAMQQAAETIQWNAKVQEMHQLYGDFVRIGKALLH